MPAHSSFCWQKMCSHSSSTSGIVAIFTATCCLFLCGAAAGQELNENRTEAWMFLAEYNSVAMGVYNNESLKAWELDTNITSFNQEQLIQAESFSAKFKKDMRNRALAFKLSAMSPDTRRQLQIIRNIGTAAQPDQAKVEELAMVKSDMVTIFSRARVCVTPDRCGPSGPNNTEKITTTGYYDKMVQLWVGWRNETGRKIKSLYSRFVELSNEAVSFVGFPDTGAMWRATYETPTIEDDIRALWEQVRPLYQQLHAYVRRKLKKFYGKSRFPKSGHIPAHILGSMCAEKWDSIYNLVVPFKNRPSIDVTDEMVRQNYTVNKFFRTSEDFFTSIGFKPMSSIFWNQSMFKEPTDGREVVCHPSAWDFWDQKDFRISMCTAITQQYFMTVHHEMGHVAYFMEYKKLPLVYRDGANDGFHEAVGDVMTLSVQTPEHLHKLGLISEVPEDEEGDINFLMNMALQKIAFLPFAYLIDLWRWDVFSGQTTPDTYNAEWWRLRCELQGVSPPVPRSEEDFDPGAKYHIPSNTPYLRYFISYIVQFQFHKAACEAAGHTGPLHRCDIYGNHAAGEKFRSMLSLGSSQPWPVAMQQLTGQDKMDAGPLLEYFEPLHRFLRQENGDDVGWDPACSQ